MSIIDEWIEKLQSVAGVVVDGAKEKAGDAVRADVTQKLTDLAKKGKDVTVQVVTGVKDGVKLDVEAAHQRVEAIKNPHRSLIALAVSAGLATSVGVSYFFIKQEVALRHLHRRAISQDWTVEPPDGLIGPMGPMYRPLMHEFRGITRQCWANSSTKPLTVSAIEFCESTASAVGRPTSAKVVYHGLMFVAHAAAFIVRYRYHYVKDGKSDENLREELEGTGTDIERMAFRTALAVKCWISGTPIPEPPKTRTDEALPTVTRGSVLGTGVMALWHLTQCTRAWFEHHGRALPTIGDLSPRLQHHLRREADQCQGSATPSAVQRLIRVGGFIWHSVEMWVLFAESGALLGSLAHLMTTSTASRLTATAALRGGLLLRWLATRHRFFDDTEHALHGYSSVDRQALYLHSLLLAIRSVIRPRSNLDQIGRLPFAVSNMVAIGNFLITVGIFSVPRRSRPAQPGEASANLLQELQTMESILSLNTLAQCVFTGLHYAAGAKTTTTSIRVLGAEIALLLLSMVFPLITKHRVATRRPSEEGNGFPPQPPPGPLPTAPTSGEPRPGNGGETSHHGGKTAAPVPTATATEPDYGTETVQQPVALRRSAGAPDSMNVIVEGSGEDWDEMGDRSH
jgi:hypothetical protein